MNYKKKKKKKKKKRICCIMAKNWKRKEKKRYIRGITTFCMIYLGCRSTLKLTSLIHFHWLQSKPSEPIVGLGLIYIFIQDLGCSLLSLVPVQYIIGFFLSYKFWCKMSSTQYYFPKKGKEKAVIYTNM